MLSPSLFRHSGSKGALCGVGQLCQFGSEDRIAPRDVSMHYGEATRVSCGKNNEILEQVALEDMLYCCVLVS